MNIKLMKKAKLIIILLLTFNYKDVAQTHTVDTIQWYNGNYSVVSELDPVWIDLKKGATIKDAKLHTIDTTSGKIEYLLDGTYHDVFVSDVKKIQPGKFYDEVITFKDNRTAHIDIDPSAEFSYNVKSKFKSRVTPKPRVAVKKEEVKQEVKEIIVAEENDYSQANSAIIFSNEKKLHIKLLSVNGEYISYKRLDLLNGPTYFLNLGIPGSMKKARVNTVNGYTIIDYRL
jgi:hypothetical protein